MITFPIEAIALHAGWEVIFKDHTSSEVAELINDIFIFMKDGKQPNYRKSHMNMTWKIIHEQIVHDIEKHQHRKRAERVKDFTWQSDQK